MALSKKSQNDKLLPNKIFNLVYFYLAVDLFMLGIVASIKVKQLENR